MYLVIYILDIVQKQTWVFFDTSYPASTLLTYSFFESKN